MEERLYTDEQVQEILRMASQASLGGGGISSRQLRETAAELGISSEEVLQAEQAFLRKHQLEKDHVEFMEYKRKHFLKDVSSFVSGSVFLYGIAFVTNGQHLSAQLLDDWPKWPVGFWAIFLIKDAIEYATEMTVNRQAAFEKWQRKRDKKLEAAKAGETKVEGYIPPTIPNTEISTDPAQVEQNQAHS
jgi:hypothetical protein